MAEKKKTLLVALSHPDDEVSCAGTVAAHTARGDRVVLLWLTRGEMTHVLAAHGEGEVARLRTEHGEQAAQMLGAEARFLDMPDTAIETTRENAIEVAKAIADVRPDAVLTWGGAWARGMRHPDHQATGELVRNAVTYARIGRLVEPAPAHRESCPVFTLRGRHSTLPARAVDVSDQLDRVLELAAFYRERVGWPERDWLLLRLHAAGEAFGVRAAEVFDAWETPGGIGSGLV